MRKTWAAALVLLAAAAAAAVAPKFNLEAVRVNNRGVAEMSQQFPAKAAATFAEAFKKDPGLAQAAINEGIALLYLQKTAESKQVLEAALKLEPENAQAWFNLGLAQHAEFELEKAAASFEHAIKTDPRDADSYYYEAACYQELKQFDKAIAIYRKALEIDPLHASSEFGLARALQHQGGAAEAKVHFKAFQHMTNTKISSALGLSYGERGHYSTVTPVEEPEAVQAAMIPMRLVAAPLAGRGGWIYWHGRGLHDGRDWVGHCGPGANGERRAGDCCAAPQGRRGI